MGIFLFHPGFTRELLLLSNYERGFELDRSSRVVPAFYEKLIPVV